MEDDELYDTQKFWMHRNSVRDIRRAIDYLPSDISQTVLGYVGAQAEAEYVLVSILYNTNGGVNHLEATRQIASATQQSATPLANLSKLPLEFRTLAADLAHMARTGIFGAFKALYNPPSDPQEMVRSGGAEHLASDKASLPDLVQFFKS
jgi:hypothetical protein